MPNTFSGAGLDRVSWRRTDLDWLASAYADPRARAIVTIGGEVAVDAGGAPLLVEVDAAAPVEHTVPVLLGLGDDEVPRFAIEAAELPRVDGARLAGLRELAPILGQADGALMAYATAMGNWHRHHRFCSNCGRGATIAGEGGFVRQCPHCHSSHHPRTDAVVIMLVIDEARDRVLMGRQAAWPKDRFSALAGFVEPGESLEEAVAREVSEESGIAVAEVRYRSSQPWPFPGSLMLGFHCAYTGGDPVARDGELEAVRWFDRAELKASPELMLPPPQAIARTLIDEWLATSATTG